MSDIVSGFQNQVWRIIGYDSSIVILEESIPLASADEKTIVARLKELVSKHLKADEIAGANAGTNSLLQPRMDSGGGNRLIITMGENPHYIASLWRSDLPLKISSRWS